MVKLNTKGPSTIGVLAHCGQIALALVFPVAAVIATSVGVPTAPAQAAQPGVAVQSPGQTDVDAIRVTVGYGDIDITHAAGAKALYERIKAASVRACGGAPDVRLLADRAVFEKCREAAISGAVAQVDSPLLWAMAGRPARPTGLASR